jgi:hypothetical protein
MSGLIIGIGTCEKYTNRTEVIRQTWLKDCYKFGINSYFFIGRPGKPAEIIGDTIYLDCGDGYLDLPHKTVAFLEYIYKHFDFDYIFKCDDDVYIDMKTLLSLPYARYEYFGWPVLPTILDRKWHFKYVKPQLRQVYRGKLKGPWMEGGQGYFLSLRAVEVIINHYKKYIALEIYEDKLVGDIMTINNMARGSTDLIMDRVCFEKILFKNYYNADAIKFASIHPCAPQEIRWLHQRTKIVLFFLLWLKMGLIDIILYYVKNPPRFYEMIKSNISRFKKYITK